MRIIMLIVLSHLLTAFIAYGADFDLDQIFSGSNSKSSPKSFSMDGASKEAAGQVQKFNKQNEAVKEMIRDAMSSTGNSSAPMASAPSSTLPLSNPVSAGSKFTCEFDCDKGDSTIFQHKAGRLTVDVIASSRDDAVKQVWSGGKGDEVCKHAGAGGLFRPVLSSAVWCY